MLCAKFLRSGATNESNKERHALALGRTYFDQCNRYGGGTGQNVHCHSIRASIHRNRMSRDH